MSRGGKRPGSGRKAGASKALAEARASATGETPLEYMLRVMRDPMAKDSRRDDMAKSAAQFIHSRLSATTHSGPNGGPIEIAKVERVIVDPPHRDT